MMKLSALLVSIAGIAACGGSDSPDVDDDAPTGPPRAVIVAGDAATTGVLSTIDPTTREVQANVGPAGAVGADPVLRRGRGELYIVNRAENNITILDDQTLELKEQLATGADSRPQDVAWVGDKLYVPTYGTKGVIVLTRGSSKTTLIDLSADAPDGTPDCNSAFAVGRDVYVSCQLMTDGVASASGKVYVIESATDQVAAGRTIELLHKRPLGLFERIPAGVLHEGDLAMPTVNDFVEPGCVERFTPGAAPSASSCWVDGAELGGYVTRTAFQVSADAKVTFFASPRVAPASDLLAFDMPTDGLWPGALNPTTEAIVDVAVCPGGELMLYDAAPSASGVRVYEGPTERTKAVLPIGIANGKFSPHGLVCY